jgi:hypothetical protein
MFEMSYVCSLGVAWAPEMNFFVENRYKDFGLWWCWRLFSKALVNFHVTISSKVQPKIGLIQ